LAPRGHRVEESGAVTTEFVLLYGARLALVRGVIRVGLGFNAALAVADAADAVLETAQSAEAADFSALAVAKAAVGDERLVRDLAVDVQKKGGEVIVSVSAAAPRIVVGLPIGVRHGTQGPVERFIPEGRR